MCSTPEPFPPVLDLRAAVHRWVRLYNAGDIEAFVHECYTDDLVAIAMVGSDPVPTVGADALIAFERRSHRRLPSRRLQLVRMHVASPVVTIEALLTAEGHAQWRVPFVSVHTYRGDRIAIDRNYGDFRSWPV